MFAVGNCLVCETDESARQLAFSSAYGRQKVVSFDGTLFQKSGLISGGSSELKQKAKRWDEKHLDQLRKKKDDHTEHLREQLKIRRKEPELVDLRSNIKGLEYRLRYSKQNKDIAEQKVIFNLEKEIKTLIEESKLHDVSFLLSFAHLRPDGKFLHRSVSQTSKKSKNACKSG
jgi:structural maintenance of chromosome 1